MEKKQEWLMERKNYIGGSDLGAIAGLNPYRTALDVYLDKTSDDITEETSPAMRWGNFLEDVVAKAYSEDTGYDVEIEPNTIYRQRFDRFKLKKMKQAIVSQLSEIFLKI